MLFLTFSLFWIYFCSKHFLECFTCLLYVQFHDFDA